MPPIDYSVLPQLIPSAFLAIFMLVATLTSI